MLTSTATISIFLLAGFLQGLTGFGAALIAMPLMCLLVDLQTAVPLCILNSIVITAFLLIRLNSHIQLDKILALCISAVPGIYVGTSLLTGLDASLLGALLGILLMVYSAFNLFTTPRPRNLHIGWAYLSGFASGALGSAFSTGGPPTIIYTTLNDWSKHQIKATLTSFFAFNSVLTALVHAFSGLTTTGVLKLFLWSAPAVLIGTAAGSLLYDRLPRESFIRLVYYLLFLLGGTLLL